MAPKATSRCRSVAGSCVKSSAPACSPTRVSCGQKRQRFSSSACGANNQCRGFQGQTEDFRPSVGENLPHGTVINLKAITPTGSNYCGTLTLREVVLASDDRNAIITP